MAKISEQSALKLQKILKKKLGRTLTEEELELSYIRLMDFAFKMGNLHANPAIGNKEQGLRELAQNLIMQLYS